MKKTKKQNILKKKAKHTLHTKTRRPTMKQRGTKEQAKNNKEKTNCTF